MKTDLKAKYIQHLISKKNNNEGFTLIELLVVIIIIGILSAIALPSFLNQANKAKQSEAKTYVGSMNRGQQAHYVEFSAFTADVNRLGVGIESNTTNYTYTINHNVATDDSEYAMSQGASNSAALRSYAGNVYLEAISELSETTSKAILCESNTPGVVTTPSLTAADGDCPGGYTKL